MEALNDDTIIDSINLNCGASTTTAKDWKSSSNRHHHHHHHRTKHSHHNSHNRCNENGGGGHSKKSKRLPWNCDVIRDRFTPQPYPIQLVEFYLENKFARDVIILAQNPALKRYLMLAGIQLHHQKQVWSKTIFVVNYFK